MTNAGTGHRKELARLLRGTLSCPRQHKDEVSLAMLGMPGMQDPRRQPLRIIAIRPTSIRLECADCGLRFGIHPVNLADVLAAEKTPSPEQIEALARKDAAANLQSYHSVLAHYRREVDRIVGEEREKVLGPHREAIAAAKPRKGQIRFPKR